LKLRVLIEDFGPSAGGGGVLKIVTCGLLAGRAGIEEEEVAHGFARIDTDWRLVCPALPFKSDAVFFGGESAVPAD